MSKPSNNVRETIIRKAREKAPPKYSHARSKQRNQLPPTGGVNSPLSNANNPFINGKAVNEAGRRGTPIHNYRLNPTRNINVLNKEVAQKIEESAVVKSFVSGTNQQLFSNPRSNFFDIVKEDFDSKLTFMFSINPTLNKDCSFTINTGDHSTPSITLWVEMEDTIPSAPEKFTFTPHTDNLRHIKFTWNIQDSDLWYGLLFVSDKQINSQYHSAIAHFPLNEKTNASKVYKPDSGENYISSSGTANTGSNGTIYSVEGLAGYTKTLGDKTTFFPMAE